MQNQKFVLCENLVSVLPIYFCIDINYIPYNLTTKKLKLRLFNIRNSKQRNYLHQTMSIPVRIKKDFEHMKSEYSSRLNPGSSCCFEILEDTWKKAVDGSLSNQRDFNLLIRGPDDSPYANGLFEVNIKLNETYPMKPPKITFLSEIYHPNIRGSSICLSTLKDGSWSPALMLYKVLMSLQALLADPNPDDPLDPESANEFKANKARFLERAHETTNRAMDKIKEKRCALAQKNA